MKKTQNTFPSPDMMKFQEVVIDHRTKIYITPGADPVEARDRFISRFGYKVSESPVTRISSTSDSGPFPINRFERNP
jgi:hypothetical protein